ncbi:MAG: Na+/H+ antiporter NhaA [Solirubrobacteraceae bacterium]|nr:Na+/H+ antiporter NhaA [Solirubrobacteraceae bacterium]
MATAAGKPDQTVPRRRILLAQLTGPLRNFVATEAGSAGILLVATLVAVLWANSPLSDVYEDLWHTEFVVRLGSHAVEMDLKHWVDDGLMVLFFFVVGLEVRRELSVGELRDRSRLVVPSIAALGGVLVPTALYLALNPSGEAASGWGVVIGTDTAFLLGALALIGPACPTQLRVFLLTLSIADDLVAVSVIGAVYSDTLDPVMLAIAAACLVALAVLSRMAVWRTSLYLVVGAVLWLATLESGLHPSIAGMAAGLLIAARAPRREEVEQAASAFRAFRQSPLPDVGYTAARGLQRAVSVNERLQTVLHPWTGYVIVPIFALANAGVDLRDGVLADALSSPITWGVVVGLVAGKLFGVGAGILGALRLRLGELPQGVGTGQAIGGAALSGIGFTVSLLIADLAFDSDELADQATVGVLIAAVLAAGLGWIVFKLAAVLRGERTASLPMVLSSPVDPARDHVRGRPDAPLTLIEYGDFECPFCGRATGVVAELRARFGDELRYVFRHLPLTDVHPHAELAAHGAEAASAQGAFWEMHDLLFAHQDELTVEDLAGYAGELGLDVERFLDDLENTTFADHVRDDVAGAEASGARGTPTFFVGTRRHVGPYDAESLARELRASSGAAAVTG